MRQCMCEQPGTPCPLHSEEPYVPVRIEPDPERDARVAARRAADAKRAGIAFDHLFPSREGTEYYRGWDDGYRASEVHHNRHYGVPDDGDPDRDTGAGLRLIREGWTPDLADDDCLRMTDDPRLSTCPAAGSPRCLSCVWRPAAGER